METHRGRRAFLFVEQVWMDGCGGSDEQLQERRGLGNSKWLQPWRPESEEKKG
jgi:hypothetical protein